MVIDSTDYLGATDPSEKDEVAIINTDTADADADQLVELPRADDCASSSTPSLRFPLNPILTDDMILSQMTP